MIGVECAEFIRVERTARIRAIRFPYGPVYRSVEFENRTGRTARNSEADAEVGSARNERYSAFSSDFHGLEDNGSVCRGSSRISDRNEARLRYDGGNFTGRCILARSGLDESRRQKRTVPARSTHSNIGHSGEYQRSG